MMTRRDNDPLAIAARVTFLTVILLVTFASLAPVQWVPKFFYSFHLEHFAAFYVMAVAMAAARYRAHLNRVLLDAVILASVLEGVRAFTPVHRLSAAEDWIADVGGALAALVPVMVGDFRRTFGHEPEGSVIVDESPGGAL